MQFPSNEAVANLRSTWEGQYVEVVSGAPAKFQRFLGKLGRVVTVSKNGYVIVDFADGAWYDVSHPNAILLKVDDPERIKTFDTTANSAQPLPTRQA
jgi:hypothetical protein